MSVVGTSKHLRIMVPDVRELDDEDKPQAEQQIEETINGINWDMYEQLLNDSMPDGYYCKIEDV